MPVMLTRAIRPPGGSRRQESRDRRLDFGGRKDHVRQLGIDDGDRAAAAGRGLEPARPASGLRRSQPTTLFAKNWYRYISRGAPAIKTEISMRGVVLEYLQPTPRVDHDETNVLRAFRIQKRGLGGCQGGASDRARPRRFGQTAGLGPGQDAALVDRRRDRIGKVRLHQLDRHFASVFEKPEGRSSHHGRPQGGRAEGIQHPSAC